MADLTEVKSSAGDLGHEVDIPFRLGFESDKLDELLAGENGFTLQRLLSEFSGTDFNIDANNMIKIDSQTLSEFVSRIAVRLAQ